MKIFVVLPQVPTFPGCVAGPGADQWQPCRVRLWCHAGLCSPSHPGGHLPRCPVQRSQTCPVNAFSITLVLSEIGFGWGEPGQK